MAKKLSKTQERVFQMLNKTKEQPIQINFTQQSIFNSMLKIKKLANGTIIRSKAFKVGNQVFIGYADNSGVTQMIEGTYDLQGGGKMKVDRDSYITSITK